MSITCLIATIIMMCTEKLSIVSYNSGGLGDINREIIEDILTDSGADIVLLQETWLLQRDLGILNSFNTNFYSKREVICQRQYNFMWQAIWRLGYFIEQITVSVC